MEGSDKIKETIRTVIVDIFSCNLRIKDILDISSLALELKEKCSSLYAITYYDTVMKFIPSEVWFNIFNYLKDSICLLYSRTVSKQWNQTILQLKYINITNTSLIYSMIPVSRIILQFKFLDSLILPYVQPIDFKLFTKLKKLSLKRTGSNNETVKFENLSFLTNLTSLSISKSNLVTDKILLSFPEQMKLSITYLNINENKTITSASLKQFTNLTKLNIKNNEISFLPTLPRLHLIKVTQNSLKRLVSYNGTAQISFFDHVYLGEVSKGQINGKGICHYKRGEYYDGFYQDGQIHGFGIYKFSSGLIYKGEWIYGMRHGKGIEIQKNGDKCEGIWENGKYVSGIKKFY